MSQQQFTCISCPIGCLLTVEVADGQVVSVSGNSCARGVAYAQSEAVAPVRTLTSTLPLKGGPVAAVPIKTRTPVPKERIWDAMRALRGVQLSAPVTVGQVAVADAAGTGVDWVVTRSLPATRDASD